MNYRLIINTLGYVLGLEAACMMLPLFTALLYKESSALPILITIFILAIVALLFIRIKKRNNNMYAKEGFVIVTFAWILVSFFGAIPFYISGAVPSFIDCFFETVSGFTTTGASILNDIEAMPKALLLWRSFTHWIGGMGVLVLMMALLPLNNERSMHVMRAEVPGPSVGKLLPKARSTAKMLYTIYLFLSIIEVLFLLLGKMPFFDALVTTFGTAGTGGFSCKSLSIAAYNSAYIDGVVTVFMLLFGVNFNLYFFLVIREVKNAFKSEELICYFSIFAVSTILVTLNILPMVRSMGTAFRQASFQVSSIMTTTGFATADFNLWPTLSKVTLFLLMIVGASGGSTGGGLKVSRVMIVVKSVWRDIFKMIHPRSVKLVHMDGKKVEEETVKHANGTFIIYIFVIFIMTFLISFDGFDFETTLSAVTACIGNIGPGFGMVGPMGNFAAFSWFSKCLLSFTMLFGRLEIFPLIIALSPSIYRKK